MPPPEMTVIGPSPLTDQDIGSLNRVFAESFTDRYRRDGLVGVRVPRLNPMVWRYSLRDAGPGAMMWTDPEGEIVAFNMAHRSGREAWMGPLAVRPDGQGSGVGQAIVRTAVEWMQQFDVATIGLETMPRTVDNIGFYSRLGFVPGNLTVTLVGDARRCDDTGGGVTLSELETAPREELITACAGCLRDLGGADYSHEIRLTHELALGDTIVVADDRLRGFALWHATPLVEGRPAEEVRLLKLFADSEATFGRLIDLIERVALDRGLASVSIRCQTGFESAYLWLVDRGYRVRWTDLRMTLRGYPLATLPPGAVLFSNWEI